MPPPPKPWPPPPLPERAEGQELDQLGQLVGIQRLAPGEEEHFMSDEEFRQRIQTRIRELPLNSLVTVDAIFLEPYERDRWEQMMEEIND